MSYIEPIFVSVEEAGRVIGFRRTKVYELIKQGELTPIKIGASTRIDMAELKAWAARKREESQRQTA